VGVFATSFIQLSELNSQNPKINFDSTHRHRLLYACYLLVQTR
jgi:hypothetical protein